MLEQAGIGWGAGWGGWRDRHTVDFDRNFAERCSGDDVAAGARVCFSEADPLPDFVATGMGRRVGILPEKVELADNVARTGG